MASIQLRGGQQHTVKPETGINTTRAAPSTIARSRFISGFLLAGGTGIEPATYDFGERGGLSHHVSCNLSPAAHLRSVSVSVSRRRTASARHAVKSAVSAPSCKCERRRSPGGGTTGVDPRREFSKEMPETKTLRLTLERLHH